MNATTEWKFEDAPSAAVYTTRAVVDGLTWIAYAFHDEDDGAWQFHGASDEVVGADELKIIRLGEVLDLDSSLSSVADLPIGWKAWRESPWADWQCAPHEASP